MSQIIIKCCSCGVNIRLPHNRGKLQVTCPRCRNVFIYDSGSREIETSTFAQELRKEEEMINEKTVHEKNKYEEKMVSYAASTICGQAKKDVLEHKVQGLFKYTPYSDWGSCHIDKCSERDARKRSSGWGALSSEMNVQKFTILLHQELLSLGFKNIIIKILPIKDKKIFRLNEFGKSTEKTPYDCWVSVEW